jgi:predicted nucleic acid-binding protein
MIWGEIMGEAERMGRSKAGADAQIASIARRHGLVMVTRNTRGFTDMSVELLDPWMA